MANFTTDLLYKLREAGQQLESMERDHQTSRPKIQRVPDHLRDRQDFKKYYSPRLVSFGPIHHGENHLQLGEQYKRMWASMYLQRTNKFAIAEYLYQRILEDIKNLKDLYNEDAIGCFSDEKLSEILFVDGYSLLQVLDKFDFFEPRDLRVKVDKLAFLQQDVLLFENQLPFQLLEFLTDENIARRATERFIDYFDRTSLHELKGDKNWSTDEIAKENGGFEEIKEKLPSPPHLLHQLRNFLLSSFLPGSFRNERFYQQIRTHKNIYRKSTTYRNIKELKEAGIKVKRSESPIEVSFVPTLFGGKLKLSKIVVDGIIAPIFLNLIAYEMCPDFENQYEISSYVNFLDSLIDHPDDVKELRAAGILHNSIGSDEEVAKFFNNISTDSVPEDLIYVWVREEIEKHYTKRYKTWLAQACHTYFNSPWTIIAFLAAFLALILTAAQTWLTVYPPKFTSK